jgi:hypothetical protein
MFLSKAHLCLVHQLYALEVNVSMVDWRRPYFRQFGALGAKIEIFNL